MSEWCETIIGECPNCGAIVELVRYDDEEVASGLCRECNTLVEVELS